MHREDWLFPYLTISKLSRGKQVKEFRWETTGKFDCYGLQGDSFLKFVEKFARKIVPISASFEQFILFIFAAIKICSKNSRDSYTIRPWTCWFDTTSRASRNFQFESFLSFDSSKTLRTRKVVLLAQFGHTLRIPSNCIPCYRVSVSLKCEQFVTMQAA